MDGRELTAAKHTLTILRGTQLPFPFPSPLHRYDLMILKAADLKGETDFPLYCKRNSETTAKYKPMGKVLDPNCDAVKEEKKQEEWEEESGEEEEMPEGGEEDASS